MKFKSLLAYLTLCTGDPLDIIYPSRLDLVNKNHTYAGLAKDPLDTKHSPPPMWNPQDKRKADIHLLCQSTWDPQIFFFNQHNPYGPIISNWPTHLCGCLYMIYSTVNPCYPFRQLDHLATWDSGFNPSTQLHETHGKKDSVQPIV